MITFGVVRDKEKFVCGCFNSNGWVDQRVNNGGVVVGTVGRWCHIFFQHEGL